ncbi:MAG: LysR family transcriptional regulator [Bdellovibrionaceae bacterium]|nr:LysR family transcriptional regulator [Bdellovibrio sp.]
MDTQVDYNQIALFIEIVDSGSISEAARRLNQAKSNLSRALSSLESQLGAQLIYRNTRSLHPTQAGLNFYEKCKVAYSDINHNIASLKLNEQTLRGRFCITAAMDLAQTIFPAILSDFSRLHHELQIEMRGENKMIDLVREGIDLAVRIGTLNNSNLKAAKICDLSLILVATNTYLAGRPKIKTLENLKDHAIISFNKNFEKTLSLSRRGGSLQKVNIHPCLLANDSLVAKSFTLNDSGIALLPDFLCYEEIKSGQLTRVLPDFASRPVPIHFIWSQHQTTSPKVRAFIDFSKDRMKKFFTA